MTGEHPTKVGYFAHGRACDLSDCYRVSSWGRWEESEYEGRIWVCDRCCALPPPAEEPETWEAPMFSSHDIDNDDGKPCVPKGEG